MNKNRDYFLIHRLREHYDALMHNFKGIVTVDDFLADDVIKKAILFDLFQIGELIANQLSKESLSKIDKNDLWGVISVRNYVVHGYYVLEYDKIINSINNDLPRLVTIIENIVKNNYNEELNKMMNDGSAEVKSDSGTSRQSLDWGALGPSMFETIADILVAGIFNLFPIMIHTIMSSFVEDGTGLFTIESLVFNDTKVEKSIRLLIAITAKARIKPIGIKTITAVLAGV